MIPSGTPRGRSIVLVLTLISGASLVASPATARQAGKIEPRALVVHNAASLDLRRISLVEHGKPEHRALRMGMLAPVPVGSVQRVDRSSSAPRLPRKIVVEWTDAEGREFREIVDLKPILREALGNPGEALVFRVGPVNVLDVFVGADSGTGP